MSRIDEAWSRASGRVPYSRESAARADRLDEPPETVLHRFPRESEPSGTSAEAPDRLLPRATPWAEGRRKLGALHGEFERKLVVSSDAAPIAVEQYRRLAGALHELQVEQGLKTLMVTSTLPNEGKTLTAANLALTLSESCERRVLLIDADLRHPFLHEVFGLSNATGLSDMLRSERDEIPLVQVSEFLSVLPAGHLDQPMALTSDRMRVLLDQFTAGFDWVVIDAAPVGFIPDAQLLARLTRAVLFVIAANSTPHVLVSRAIAALGPECVVGTVLNYVETHNIPAAGYYEAYYPPDHPAD